MELMKVLGHLPGVLALHLGHHLEGQLGHLMALLGHQVQGKRQEWEQRLAPGAGAAGACAWPRLVDQPTHGGCEQGLEGSCFMQGLAVEMERGSNREKRFPQ